MLHGSDRIEEAASKESDQDLYRAQLDIFLDPHDPAVIAQARKDGVPEAWLESAKHSPVYQMAIDWKIAFPLHPEYRTLSMVWYVPPLSPIQAKAQSDELGMNGAIPDVSQLRIPLRYLANMLTAGDEYPVKFALERLLAMRAYMRARHVDGVEAPDVLAQVNLDKAMVEDMYRILAIANYEDRFVIPTTHREYAENAYDLRSTCGFSLAMVAPAMMAVLGCSADRRIDMAPRRMWRAEHANLSGSFGAALLPGTADARGIRDIRAGSGSRGCLAGGCSERDRSLHRRTRRWRLAGCAGALCDLYHPP